MGKIDALPASWIPPFQREESLVEMRNRAVSVLRRWMEEWAFPQHCILCTEPGAALCGPCREDLPGLHAPRCPICAVSSVRAEVCGQCLAHPPRFAKVIVALSYGFPVDALIRRLKYGADLSLTDLLAALLAERAGRESQPDCVIPMPLSAQRLRERGFNQSHEIARNLARRLHLPLADAACKRIRHTPPQASLPLDERRANIRGAFQCSINLDGARVVVVDDVLTSGATLNELTRELLRAGAAEVNGWVLARTERG
jgi:ComF family protein